MSDIPAKRTRKWKVPALIAAFGMAAAALLENGSFNSQSTKSPAASEEVKPETILTAANMEACIAQARANEGEANVNKVHCWESTSLILAWINGQYRPYVEITKPVEIPKLKLYFDGAFTVDFTSTGEGKFVYSEQTYRPDSVPAAQRPLVTAVHEVFRKLYPLKPQS